ncbi:MAG: NAD-dependent epimerase/dehydratase family protein [Rhodocyclaceae bacterium]|nr:NAD-dependent epimerase/dehydratase family protein [Rhodocyclaceae bacterium]
MGSINLITGATGFIGRRLRQADDRALVRSGGAVKGAVIGDLLNKVSLGSACDGVACIFHCAGYAHAFSSFNPELHWCINFEGTRNLLDAAGEAGVKRFVFLSSVKAMAEPGDACADEDWSGEPLTPYGKAKRAAEDAVLEAGAKYGMHVVNLRLVMVYGRGGRGNLERMAQGIKAGWFPPLPEAGNRRSLVHVDDVVAVMRLVAEKTEANGRTYIVADPKPYSGRGIYDAIRIVLAQGADPPAPTFPWRVPAGLLQAGGAVGDLLGALLRRQLPLNSEVVDRLLGSAWYSPARIESELGWRAQIGLSEGLREMLDTFGKVPGEGPV